MLSDSAKLWIVSSNWVSHDELAQKPCCRLDRMELSSRCVIRFFVTICSMALHKMQVKEIGQSLIESDYCPFL